MNAENRAADKAALSYSLADGLTFTRNRTFFPLYRQGHNRKGNLKAPSEKADTGNHFAVFPPFAYIGVRTPLARSFSPTFTR